MSPFVLQRSPRYLFMSGLDIEPGYHLLTRRPGHAGHLPVRAWLVHYSRMRAYIDRTANHPVEPTADDVLYIISQLEKALSNGAIESDSKAIHQVLAYLHKEYL